MELVQGQLAFKRVVGLEKARARVACIGIEYANFGLRRASIDGSPLDGAAIIGVITGGNIENRGLGADAALEKTYEAIRAENHRVK